MHICYVANSRFPSERAHMTQMVQMCNAFAHNGHRVTLIVTDRKTNITETPEVFFGVPIHFDVARVRVPDIAGRSPNIPVFLRPYLFLIQRLVFAWGARRVIRERGCTHLYGRDEGILFLLAKATRIPVVWESHEAKFTRTARVLIAVAHRVVVISPGILKFYTERGVDVGKLIVAHDAVDDRFFEPLVTKAEAQKKLGYTSTKPLVLYIGGLDAWKGTDTLFACSTDHDTFTIGIIGGKEEEIKKLRIEYPHVVFFGSRPYRELPILEQAGDVLVIPNTAKNALSREYTSPLKLFTYLTAKKPIVASRIPSIQNVVNDDEVFFFDPDNHEDLRDVILNVLKSPERSMKRAQSAYEKSKEYTWVKRAKHIADFIGA